MSGNYWFRSRGLLDSLSSVLGCPNAESAGQLEHVLRQDSALLSSFASHKAKSPSDRQALQKAAETGGQVVLKDEAGGSRGSLSVDPRQGAEALLLSDVFQLNETLALELLAAGDAEAGRLGLGRGLAAVLAFHAHTSAAAQAVRLLFASRSGRLWTPPGHDHQLSYLVHQTTDRLWDQGLLQTYLKLLEDASVAKEMERLREPSVKGVGGPKHAAALREALESYFGALASTVLLYSAQEGLRLQDIQALLGFFKKRSMGPVKEGDFGTEWRAGVDGTLLVALLFGLDASLVDDVTDEDELQLLRLAREDNLVPGIGKELINSTGWRDPGILAILQLAWATSIRQLAGHGLSQHLLDSVDVDEEEVWESAVDLGAFQALRLGLTTQPPFRSQGLWQRRLHSLATGTILSFPLKLKELRAGADEELRRAQDPEAPAQPLRLPFRHFLLLLQDLYNEDPLKLRLSEELLCSGGDETLLFSAKSVSPKQASLGKFVESAGELLPAQLYVEYLELLRSLASSAASAQAVFTLLRNNGLHGPHSHLSALSWNRLFGALQSYLSLLKGPEMSERPGLWNRYGGGAAAAPVGKVEFRAEELAGLVGWLGLAARVASWDAAAAAALTESAEWRALPRLVELGASDVPLRLKAAVWELLAALVRTNAHTAAQVSGLLCQAGVFALASPKEASIGVLRELEEVEVRLEEYPATLGFLRLLAALTSHPPSSCAEPKSFAAFTDAFLLRAVLGKFLNRPYKATADMWRMGQLCFEALGNLVEGWTQSQDSVASGAGDESSKDAGMLALRHLVTEGPSIRFLLSYLVKAESILSLFPEELEFKTEVEEGSLAGLRLLAAAVNREEWLQLIRSGSSTALPAASARQILLSANPASGSPDYLACVAAFAGLSRGLPRHAAAVASFLRSLARHPTFQWKMSQLLRRLGGPDLQPNFAGLLDLGGLSCPLWEEEDTDSAAAEEEARVRGDTALCVLEMLLESLGGADSSFAELLLGFQEDAPSATHIEEAGVDGCPRSVLHAATELVQAALEGDLESLPFRGLVEPAGRLLAQLCGDAQLGPPTLRFLRSSHDLFGAIAARLCSLPLHPNLQPSERGFLAHLHLLLAQEVAHLLNTGQISQVQRLVVPLLSRQEAGGEQTLVDTMASSRFLSQTLTSLSRTLGAPSSKSGEQWPLLRLLREGVCLEPEELGSPELGFFDGRKLSRVISLCTRQGVCGNVECDVVQLHAVMEKELSALATTTAAAQEPQIQDEIAAVLQHVLRHNALQRRLALKLALWEGWRSLCETLLLPAVDAALLQSGAFASAEAQTAAYARLLSAVLEKATAQDAEAASQALPGVASVALALTSALRRVFRASTPEDDGVLDETLDGTRSEAGSFFGGAGGASYLTVLDGTRVGGARAGGRSKTLTALQEPLRRLCDFIAGGAGPKDAETKVYAYGALLNFLCLLTPERRGRGRAGPEATEVEAGGEGWSLRERMGEEHWKVIASFGPALASAIARDATHGTHALKSVALSGVSWLLWEDGGRGGSLLAGLSRDGALRGLVESLRGESGELLDALSSLEAPLGPLYLHQAKMAALARIATSPAGLAKLVGEARLVEVLRETSLLAASPPPAFAALSQAQRDEPATSLLARYYAVAEGTLRLLLALCTGPEAQADPAVVAKVLGFLCANGEAVIWLFGGRSSDSTEAALLRGPVAAHPRTVALLSAVLARACTVPVDIGLSGGSLLELETGRDSFLRALLGLLRIASDYPAHLRQADKEPSKELRFRGGLGSAAPLLGREALGKAWREGPMVREILQSLVHCLHCFSTLTASALERATETGGLDAVVFTEPSLTERGPKAALSLASLGQTLRTGLAEWTAASERLTEARLCLADLPEMALAELEKLEAVLGLQGAAESRPLRAAALRSRLLELASELREERRLLREAVSEALFLLWAQLDYFLRVCAPRSSVGDMGPSVYSLLTQRPSAEAGHTAAPPLSPAQHSALRAEAAALFGPATITRLAALYKTPPHALMDPRMPTERFHTQHLQKIMRLVRS